MNINLLCLLHLEVWKKFAQFLFLQNKIVKIEESYNNSFHTKSTNTKMVSIVFF